MGSSMVLSETGRRLGESPTTERLSSLCAPSVGLTGAEEDVRAYASASSLRRASNSRSNLGAKVRPKAPNG